MILSERKKDILFLFFIFAALVIVFFDVFLLRASFISGDHRAQHFSWACFFRDQILSGRMPLWTSMIQCGFPLLAEGQVGALYPLNWIFYALFPIHIGYTYEILFHFALGGLLFYLFLRNIGVGSWGAFYGTLVYVFGSAHAGFFYNMTSQRVAVWFPLTLLLIHQLIRNPGLVIALLLGGVFAFEALAGYQQIAVYTIGMAGLYFLWLLVVGSAAHTCRLKLLRLFSMSLVFSVLLSLPQWVSFLELSGFSSRTELVEQFAYVGSANPIGIFALLFPTWGGFLNAKIYIGILSLFFFAVSLFTRKNVYEKALIFLLVVGVLLALGQFSPVYVGLIKLTHFYGFRVPSKFLYFVSFSLAALCAFGFDKFFIGKEGKDPKWASRAFGIFIASGGAVLVLGKWILELFHEPVLEFARNYVRGHIHGSPIHPHSLETYYDKLNSMFEVVSQKLSWNHKWNLIALGFIAASAALIFLIRRKNIRFDLVAALIVGVLFLDLFLYSSISIKGDYEAFEFVNKPGSLILEHLKRDKDVFRIYEFYEAPADKDRFPVSPNFNMIHGLSDMGIYSPLAFKKYKELLADFGAVDDSLFIHKAKEEAIADNLRWLSFLNVKYILTLREIRHPGLKPVLRDGEVYLYENTEVMPRAFFTQGEIVDNRELPLGSLKYQPVRILEDHQNGITLAGAFPGPGYVVISDIHYPGWKAWVKGKETPIVKMMGLFRAVAVEAGVNHIVMEYRPWYFFPSLMVSTISLIVLLTILAVSLWKRRKPIAVS